MTVNLWYNCSYRKAAAMLRTSSGVSRHCYGVTTVNDHTTIPPKRCTKCGEEFPSTPKYFNRDRRTLDGLRSHCKVCTKKQKREYRAENRERLKRYDADYYAIHSKYMKEYSKKYQAAHPELARQYRKTHREQLREYSRRYRTLNANKRREYQRQNLDRFRINGHNYRARKRGLPNTLTIEQMQFALEYFNYCCAVCGRQLLDLFGERKLALDHWIPLSFSECPGTTVANLVPLCHGKDGCNNSKHDRDPQEWLISRFGKRKAHKILSNIETYFKVVRDKYDSD